MEQGLLILVGGSRDQFVVIQGRFSHKRAALPAVNLEKHFCLW